MNIFEKEIMRRVKELDCTAVYRENSNSVSVSFDGNIIAEIHGDTAEKKGSLDEQESEIFLHIERLYGNVANYCAAYEKGESIKNPNISDGFRRLFKIGKVEMAARYDRKSGFEFVVFNGDENLFRGLSTEKKSLTMRNCRRFTTVFTSLWRWTTR